jgi:RimJ/RimL family protein N-acetyltransferase
MTTLHTERLVMRPWRDEDLAPFAALNADPEVMRYFPSTLSREESDAGATRARTFLEANGWGLWAAEHEGAFIGFIGLAVPRFTAHFTPCVELGWRLARHAQGRGLATEGARAALAFAVRELPNASLVSFTVPTNQPSRRVMEKLGLVLDGEFDHPALPEGHALRRHVLYRHRR